MVVAKLDNIARSTLAKRAANTLGFAAFLLMVRGTLFPFIIQLLPQASINWPTTAEIRITSFTLAAFFLTLYLWARRDPLPPVLAALTAYAAIFVPEMLAEPTQILQKHGGVLIMVLILLRALLVAANHRLLRYECAE